MCGVKPYIRATTNPDADSWVADFISWWIDQESGLPIPARSGKLRWFIRVSDVIVWADSKQELIDKHGSTSLPKSVTFIPAKLEDNKKLLEADPGYRANLMAMSRVERGRLHDGNWKIRPASGLYFKKHEVTILDSIPNDVVKWVRRWDLAATIPSDENPDPDWTAGVKMGLRKNGRYIIADVIRERELSGTIREMVKRVAGNDGRGVRIGLPQDPGQAGKAQAASYIKDLTGFVVEAERETGDKVTRADPFACQWQGGNVDIVRGAWNEAYLDEMEAFPSKAHDDQVDASSGAFLMLNGSNLSTWAKLGQKR